MPTASATSPFAIRPYRPEDSDALLALERNCPQGKAISYFTHIVDHFASRSDVYRRSYIAVAEAAATSAGDRAKLCGVYCGAIKAMRWGDEIREVGYGFGLRVAPAARHRGVADALVTAVEDWWRERGAELGYVDVAFDNLPALALFRGKLGYADDAPHLCRGFPVRRRPHKLPPRVTVELLGADRAAELLAPALAAAHYCLDRRELGDLLSLPAHDCTVVVSSGMSRASLSLYRAEQVMDIRFVALPRSLRLATRALNAASRLAPRLVPGLPDLENAGMRHRYAFALSATGDRGAELLAAAYAWAHNRCARAGVDIVLSLFDAGDPLVRAMPSWRIYDATFLRLVKPVGDRAAPNSHPGAPTATPSGFFDPRDS